MRVDKFLKVSRIVKRRTVAKEACDAGRVSVNGRTAKAGNEVAAGDEVAVRFGTSALRVRVVSVAENVRKEDAADMYEILSRERF
ncbi:MAG: RNA-binding S4 domain-containing protein [Clostridiales Family XIII bacterium]|jgi:ribosomal 50S subunit-recycling heat shock protein|nr:RNA-binding S4 domain-containing protein [Clostridiales Family XIII bacterium]